MAEIPTEALEAAARALGDAVKPSDHGQLCPVWTKKQPIGDCDCWILPRCRRHVALVAPALIAEGRRQAGVMVEEMIEALERIGCQFQFCDGPTLEPVDMKTCYVCELLARLQAARIAEGTHE